MSEHTPDRCAVREHYVLQRHELSVASGFSPPTLDEAYAEFDRWHAEVIRAAKAEGWDEAIALAARTLENHAHGDAGGQPVTVAGMARYIPSAINPYRERASESGGGA